MWIVIVLVATFRAIKSDDAIGCDTYDIRKVYSPQTDEYWVYINRPITYPLLEMCVQACFTWEYKHAATTYDDMCLCSNKDGPWKPCTNGSEPLDVQVFKAVPKDEAYVGCYTDKGLTWKPPGNYKSHSVDSCKDICKTNGYLYASLRRGQECQCISMQYENSARTILCNMTCQQMPNEVCGGQHHLSLYKTGLSRAAEVRYIGCYEEFDSNGQAVYNPGSFQTVEECLSECQRSNFKYSLIKQDDSSCSCLYRSPWKESPEPVPESQCDATTAFYKFYFTKNVAPVTSSTSSSLIKSTNSAKTSLAQEQTTTTMLLSTPSAASTALMKTPVDHYAPNVVVKESTTTSIPPGKTKSSGNVEIVSGTSIIIGAVIGGVLLIVIVIFIIYIVRRRRDMHDSARNCELLSAFCKKDEEYYSDIKDADLERASEAQSGVHYNDVANDEQPVSSENPGVTSPEHAYYNDKNSYVHLNAGNLHKETQVPSIYTQLQ